MDTFGDFSEASFDELIVRRSDGIELLPDATSRDPDELFVAYDAVNRISIECDSKPVNTAFYRFPRGY